MSNVSPNTRHFPIINASNIVWPPETRRTKGFFDPVNSFPSSMCPIAWFTGNIGIL